ncbi:MAG: glutamate--tRNA ligase [Bacteroidales bacterium]
MLPRLRFAPSPTGPLHIGGVRTALFNYLYAKKHGGTFILRIEDTDQTRFVPGAEEYIIESFKWCGITFDEGVGVGGEYGPYRQSERKHIYKQYADQLIASGDAYYAFDTPEELDTLRKEAEAQKETFTYNCLTRTKLKNSLTLDKQTVEAMLQSGVNYVIRYKMPVETDVRFTDIIRGDVTMNTKELDDKVLFKSDGMPTYHLANVVDDYLMKITHVVRGEEWLSSTPLHVLLYKSFGWTEVMPQFAHLPLILKPKGSGKLSKRDGDAMGFPVFPLEWKGDNGEKTMGYREEGYLPEAFINMLALLGWNDGSDKEIYSMEELIEAFSFERVGKSGSKFDPEKTVWFNHQYLQKKSDAEIAQLFLPYLKEKGFDCELQRLEKICGLVKERVSFVKDLWGQCFYMFIPPMQYDEATVKKRWKPEIPEQLHKISKVIEQCEPFTAHKIEDAVKQCISDNAMNVGGIFNALRLCLVGSSMGIHLFDICEIIGKQETLQRIETAIQTIKIQ